jgi:hypothetical protein
MLRGHICGTYWRSSMLAQHDPKGEGHADELGRSEAARELIRPVYEAINHDFESEDLKSAKSFLVV